MLADEFIIKDDEKLCAMKEIDQEGGLWKPRADSFGMKEVTTGINKMMCSGMCHIIYCNVYKVMSS